MLRNLNKKVFFYNKENVTIINNMLSSFPKNLYDVYFKPEYSLLYKDLNNEPSCFYFQDKNRIFFYPFLFQKIKNQNKYFDISTPYGYGGPISNTSEKNFLVDAEELLNEQLLNLNVIAELIKFHPIIKNHALLENVYRGKISKTCKTISLSLKDITEDILFTKIYSYSNRKSIKKALRNKCEIITSNDKSIWDNFIKLYEKNLKNNNAHKKYFFTKEYYKIIRRSLDKNYIIFSCKYENKIISSIIILYSDYYAHCHLIGSNELARKLSANNLLHHEVVKWCKLKKINFLHFGGGFTNEESDAVYKFKKSFSNETNDFYVGERIINKEKYNYFCKISSKNKELDNNKLFKYRD